jgi:hypothetical protein
MERVEKTRSVGGRKRLRTAGDFTGGAQVVHEIARRERHSDGTFVEGASARSEHLRTCLDAAAGERHILVTTMSPRVARSAIQSSAASGPLPTITRSISSVRGTVMKLFETTNVFSAWRSATR